MDVNNFGLYFNGSLEKHYDVVTSSKLLKIVVTFSFFPSFNFFVLLFSIFIFSPGRIATDLFLDLALETCIKHRSSSHPHHTEATTFNSCFQPGVPAAAASPLGLGVMVVVGCCFILFFGGSEKKRE